MLSRQSVIAQKQQSQSNGQSSVLPPCPILSSSIEYIFIPSSVYFLDFLAAPYSFFSAFSGFSMVFAGFAAAFSGFFIALDFLFLNNESKSPLIDYAAGFAPYFLSSGCSLLVLSFFFAIVSQTAVVLITR